jgi:hypothetical protein
MEQALSVSASVALQFMIATQTFAMKVKKFALFVKVATVNLVMPVILKLVNA